jgi:hypothetical protein
MLDFLCRESSRCPISPLYSAQRKVRESGLWNEDHVDEEFAEKFLTEFRHRIDEM